MERSRFIAGMFATESGEPGSSPPLVLLHGAGGTHRHWPEEIRSLPGQRVLALDLPGHGRSPPPGLASIEAYAGSVRAALDELGEAAIVGGHSMGGAIVLLLALEARERVAGLVLVGTGAKLRVAPSLLEATKDPEAAERVGEVMADWSFAGSTGAALREDFVREVREGARGVLHDDLGACDVFDVMSRVGEIRAPTLVVCGTEDRLTPPKYSAFLSDRIPGARLELVPSAGHMVMLESVRAVAHLVAGFAAGVPRAERR